ncbi:MAG TPA: TlpA disulfide reductase family protein [Blastocatellia bacterium]|nr:TlpA disulfide reductase family protein [Blastocatellia bacterium]
MRKHTFLASFIALVFLVLSANAAGELVRVVRNKLSAGDLASGAQAAEDYKREHGVDAEYLDALGWLARGAEMLNQPDAAASYVAELRREIREEKEEWLSPLGAAIEVEGKLRAVREGRGSAINFLESEFARAKNIGLRSRIRKNINLFSLEGQPAPELNLSDFVGAKPASFASLKGKPVLLFLWAHWCGDCRAQSATLVRVTEKYRAQGLVVMAPTRYYGTGAQNKDATPAEEKAQIEKVWQETYKGLESVPVVIDKDAMIRYGVSATPTFALIDRKGIVRFYAPTRLSEAELSRRIETVLAEAP